MEHWAESQMVYEGEVVKLRVGEVTLDDGRRALREVVMHPGGVCVVPYLASRDAVVLIRQYRIALEDYALEAPAGKLEGIEDPARRVVHELEEETGYRAGRMIDTGHVYSSVGYCTEKIHLYLAFDLEQGEQRPDPDERIEIVEVPLADIRAGLRDYSITDAKTVIGLYRLLEYLDRA